MTQNDKPGTVCLIGVDGNSGAQHTRLTFGHVDVLDNGWVMCRHGTPGDNAEITYYPPHRVAKIDRDTDGKGVSGYTDDAAYRDAAIDAARGGDGSNSWCGAYHAHQMDSGTVEVYKIDDVIETDQ